MQDDRLWEDAYRHRWRYDKVVRTTHGVNCTGGCSWNVHVKNGLVVFEMQAHDYPQTRPDLPNHEPRGCQRGASFSWYLYSPHRIKYPMIRGRLLELYRHERATGKDPVEAWRAIQEDPKKRSSAFIVIDPMTMKALCYVCDAELGFLPDATPFQAETLCIQSLH